MCPGDSELRDWARQRLSYERMAELRGHLVECPSCRLSLSEHAREHHAPSANAGDDLLLRRGGMVGRYVVLDVIGAGAMGVVYAAYDPELDRKVALKLTGAALDSAEMQLQVAREARAMAQVTHPNVVGVYDAGAFRDKVFVAMELVEGSTLGDVLQRKAHHPRAVLALFLDAGAGLAAIHRAGLVHRDFKPENVLLGRDGRARVADFGLAMLPDASVRNTSVGTRKYMAPEQLRGADADSRSDQYAFCVALRDAMSAPPSADASTQTARRPPHVEAVVQRGLSEDPRARFSSMDALVAALSRDPTRRRRRVLVATIALACMAVCGALAQRVVSGHVSCEHAGHEMTAVWDDARHASIGKIIDALPGSLGARPWARAAASIDAYADDWKAQRRAVCVARTTSRHPDDAALARRDACLDRRLSELHALTDLLSPPSAATAVRAPKAVSELTALSRCANLTDDRATTQRDAARPRPLGDVLAKIRMLSALGSLKDALTLATQVVELAQKEPAALPEALFEQARLEIASGGASDSTIQRLRRAVLLADERHDDETRAEALTTLVFATSELDSTAQFDRGVQYGEEATAALRRIGGDPRLEARLHVNLGVLQMRAEHFDAARLEMERSLALLDGLPDDQLVQKSVTLTNLGVLKGEMGHLSEALPYFQRALSIREDVFGEESAELVVTLMNVGTALEGAGRHVEAEQIMRRALDLHRRVVTPGNRREILLLSNLAAPIAEQGRRDEARALLVEARAIAGRVLPPVDPRWLDPLLALGKLDVQRGDARAAVEALEEALRAAGPMSGPETLAQARFWLARALVLARADRARARSLANDALGTYVKAGARRDSDRREVATWMATVWPDARDARTLP